MQRKSRARQNMKGKAKNWKKKERRDKRQKENKTACLEAEREKGMV